MTNQQRIYSAAIAGVLRKTAQNIEELGSDELILSDESNDNHFVDVVHMVEEALRATNEIAQIASVKQPAQPL